VPVVPVELSYVLALPLSLGARGNHAPRRDAYGWRQTAARDQ
jgi:hypothetical protein